MPRGRPKEPGIKDLVLPQSPGDMAPEMRDRAEGRGALSAVPRNPIYHVQDYGALTEGPDWWRTTTSPASASFTPGKPTMRAQEKETKPGSLKVQE